MLQASRRVNDSQKNLFLCYVFIFKDFQIAVYFGRGWILVRFVGRSFIIVGLGFAVLGMVLWVSGAVVTAPAGQLWYEMDSSSLNITQAFIQRYISEGLWDSIIVPLLNRPVWEALAIVVLFHAVVGGILSSLGNKRRRRYFKI